jgi:hypothetical protein
MHMCFVVSTTILEQFRRYDIFWNSSDGTIYFGTVQTVRYILEQFRRYDIFWNSSDGTIYFVFHFIHIYDAKAADIVSGT